MNYRQIDPPESLKDYVRYYWILESGHADAPLPKTFGALADGSPGIIFCQSWGGEFYQEDKVLPDIFIYGQTTKYTQLTASGNFRTIGAYFYPHGLKSIFGFNAAELTNSCVNVDLIECKSFPHLSEQLLNILQPEQQISLLSDYLFAQLQKNKCFEDQLAGYAVGKMLSTKGNIDLKHLQHDLRLTERSFERRFNQNVGISPKLLSRIFRFQASMELLRNDKYDKLSDIAFENNYADQSHFIRSFKEFAGVSPNQYQKQSHELVQNFPEINK